MSMMTYPLREVGAFLVDELVAAYVLQKDYERAGGHLPMTSTALILRKHLKF